jgi:hypothetical protein
VAAAPAARRLEPFAVRDGQLFLEQLPLHELVAGLRGREAWLIGHAALAAALRATRGRPGAVSVAGIGPRQVLAQCAAAGCWARVTSSHELELAQEAGFPSARIVAGADVVEDGFLRDALAAGVAVIERRGRAAEANLRRIASTLGHAVPPRSGAPRALPAPLAPCCGGLLAPLLAGPPSLAIDAAWEPPAADARRPARTLVLDVLPLSLPTRRSAVPVTVRGLGERRPQRARLHGPAARGDWVVIPLPDAAAVHRPDAAHPLPLVVMVRGAAWRPLEPRRLPPVREA